MEMDIWKMTFFIVRHYRNFSRRQGDLTRHIGIVDHKQPTAIRLAPRGLGAQPLNRQWRPQRPRSVQYSQPFP